LDCIEQSVKTKTTSKKIFSFSPGVLLLGFLLIVSQYNYLVFHTLAELFSIVVAWSLFIIVWNTRKTIKNDSLIFLGIAYLFIGCVDLGHTLSYKGMGILGVGYGSNPATQLWIIARYMESITLCLFPFFLGKRIKLFFLLGLYSVITAIALFLVFKGGLFPDCYVDGVGLTLFKKSSEYIICTLLVISLFFLSRKKDLLDQIVFKYLVVSIILTIIAELAFTFYVSVYGFSNLIGHIFKMLSFYFIYKAIIYTGLQKPYSLMFKEISGKKESYRQMFETNQAVKLIIDPSDGSIVEANNAACQFYGYSKEKIISLKITDINALPPDEVMEEMKKTTSKMKLFFNFSHILASGEIREVEVYSGPIKYGERTLLYSIIHDVTRRKQIEEELLTKEERYRTILQTARDGFWLTDVNGHFLEVNDSYAQMSGYSEEELLSMKISDIEANENIKEVFKHIQKGLEIGNDHFETIHRRKDSSIFDVEVNFRYLPIEGGRFVVFTQDITERKLAERALRKSEEKFRLSFETSPDAININSVEGGKYVDVNEGFTKIMGYSREDVIGKSSVELNIWKDLNDRDRLLSELKQHGFIENMEADFRGKDGLIRAGLMSARVLNINNEDVILSITRDITKQRKLEYEIQHTQKMESIGTLAGGIAHDLNNILFPIIGHTEMLIEDIPEDSSLRDSLDGIHAGALRAKELVKQILTFSRRDHSELKVMKIQPVVEEALQLLRSTIPTTIGIKQNIQKDCGMIKADLTQMHQVIINLATNASHAMKEKGGELKISLKEIEVGEDAVIIPDMRPGVYACLTVADTGRGMSKELIAKIFDPFFTTKEVGKGTGMGLSVVHGIVKSMNGSIKVYSELGKGTEFHVYLPVDKSASEVSTTDSKVEIRGGTEQILLVDDEEAILVMETRMLERLGYKVTSCVSSIEALEVFCNSPDKFDLVITDMTMPNMSGDKLSSELLKIRPDMPILLCTGFSDNMSVEQATSLGIKSFLLKPIVTKDIAQKIRDVLD